MPSVLEGQATKPATPPDAPPTPAVVARFLILVGPAHDAEKFYSQAENSLWDVYTEPDSTKDQLLVYVKSGPDGPGLCFAAIALIPFHDPATVKPIVDRAMQRRTVPPSRICLMNAAPYVMSIGDAMYMGNGAIDQEAKEMQSGMEQLSALALKEGTGHAHAEQLRQLFDVKDPKLTGDPDYGLALWHTSAYLLGTLDLRDQALLDPMLDPELGHVFGNLLVALSFSSNRDFVGPLRDSRGPEPPSGAEAAAATARKWWKAYLQEHPNPDWRDAVLSGFHEAGYDFGSDLRATQASRELLRAMDAKSPVLRYNAYRLLNAEYGTHFDLERAFLAGKYALSFLDPSPDEKQNEARMKAYWTKRLTQP
jgi:hypothetical protein